MHGIMPSWIQTCSLYGVLSLGGTGAGGESENQNLFLFGVWQRPLPMLHTTPSPPGVGLEEERHLENVSLSPFSGGGRKTSLETPAQKLPRKAGWAFLLSSSHQQAGGRRQPSMPCVYL